MKRFYLQIVSLLLFIFSTLSLAQNSEIRLNAFVRDTDVPYNRLGQLVVQLQWSGDLDRYDVHRFENPILQNFEIQGSGSANRVATVDGVQTAIREYTFSLKPEAIGMGYVEPMIFTYTDNTNETDYHLTTNRLQVRVVDPIPEKGSPLWLFALIGFVLLVVAGFFIVKGMASKKAQKEKEAQENAEVSVPMEERYLQELKASVDLSEPTLDGAKVFSQLSKMLRRFLHDRFDAPGLEATTSEVTQFLYDKRFDDRVVNEIKEILSNADIIKFSGKPVDRPDVERTFTLIESIFQKSLRNQIGPINDSVVTED
jgi:large-conductance mechanosensitive channel